MSVGSAVGTIPAPWPVDEVELLPDAEQHKLLVATLERVNRRATPRAPPRSRRTCSRCPAPRDREGRARRRRKLPDGFGKPITERVELSLQRRAGKQQKFSTFQSLTLPAVGVQVEHVGSRHHAHRGRPADDLGPRRHEPRRSAATARGPARDARVPQRRVRVPRRRRRPHPRRRRRRLRIDS